MIAGGREAGEDITELLVYIIGGKAPVAQRLEIILCKGKRYTIICTVDMYGHHI